MWGRWKGLHRVKRDIGKLTEQLQSHADEPVSRSLKEYIVLPYQSRCRPEEVDLSAQLGPIRFRYPFFTARMQSVVGPEMIRAAGRQGILNCIPRSLPKEEKEHLLDVNNRSRLRAGQIEYTEYSRFVQPKDTLATTQRLAKSTGFSVIPVLNRFGEVRGFYIDDPERRRKEPLDTLIREIATPLRSEENPEGIPFLQVDDPTSVRDQDVERIMHDHNVNFVPIIDNNGQRLRSLAFLQRRDTNYIGLAIGTGSASKMEIDEFGPRVDTLMLDSSNAWYDDAIRAIAYGKRRFPDLPFGAGNVVTRDQFNALAAAGADYVIVGMAVGSICQTGSYRGNGRGQATAMREVATARDSFQKRTGRYVPIVLDGGISTVKDIIVALSHADFVMMGNMFNRFHEAAGAALDANYRRIDGDETIHFKESWGEGSSRAQEVARTGMGYTRTTIDDEVSGNARYGHMTNAGVTIEGVVGAVPYAGLLKPGVEDWALYMRTTISSAGGRNLKEYRDSVREHRLLERCSAQTIHDIHPHDVKT